MKNIDKAWILAGIYAIGNTINENDIASAIYGIACTVICFWSIVKKEAEG